MQNQFFLPGLAPVEATPLSLLPRLGVPDLCLPALFDYPFVEGQVRSANAKAIGRAGEVLVDSTLIRLGFESFAPGEDQGYDRVIGLNDPLACTLRLLARVQVKTTTCLSGDAYSFPMSCGYRGSPQGRRGYGEDAFDIAALVILRHNAIFFTAEKRPTHVIPRALVPMLRDKPQSTLLPALRAVQARRKQNTAAISTPDEEQGMEQDRECSSAPDPDPDLRETSGRGTDFPGTLERDLDAA
jgi:hypothetical protein